MANKPLNFCGAPYTTPAGNGPNNTTTAGTGKKGTPATYNYNGSTCKYDCVTPAGDGIKGDDAGKGGDGVNGGNGLPGLVCPWTLTDIVGDLTIWAGGGNGQDGGNGGSGGTGGAGGPAGDTNPNGYSNINKCKDGSTGPQGKGGKGGKAGDAGNGGPGSQVIIYYNSISGKVDTVVASGFPGKVGVPGNPGTGNGNLGLGDPGKTGVPGSVSTITLIQQ